MSQSELLARRLERRGWVLDAEYTNGATTWTKGSRILALTGDATQDRYELAREGLHDLVVHL